MTDLKAFANQLVNLTVKEINELTKILKDEHNIETNSINQNINSVDSSSNVSSEKAKVEKTSFNVRLEEIGTQKLSVIKTVKEITGLSLKESKEIVDNVPKNIKENIDKEEANKIKQKLESSGAKVNIV